jgi:hypothetical protein
MHQLIGIVSHADTREQARDAALAFADVLVERDEFDYYLVDSDRWKQSGRTHSLASNAGRVALAAARQVTRDAFDQALQAVRMMLAHYTDEQLYQDDFPDDDRDYYAARFQFAVIGGHTHDCYLYGDGSLWGGKLQNDTD